MLPLFYHAFYTKETFKDLSTMEAFFLTCCLIKYLNLLSGVGTIVTSFDIVTTVFQYPC